MKVLVFGYGYPSTKYPLNGIFSFYQAVALSNIAEVYYAYLDLRSVRRYRKLGFDIGESNNVKFIGLNIPIGRIPLRINYYLKTWFTRLLFKKIKVNFGEFAIVHSHFFDLAYSASKNINILNSKLVITEHSSLIHRLGNNRLVYHKTLEAYRSSSALISVSYSLKKSIQQKFRIDSLVIFNMFKEDFFYFDSNYEKYSDFTFITVGNLIKSKGMDVTIKAFYKSFFQKRNIRLIIVGDGPEKFNLANSINQLGLNSQVELIGQVDQNTLSKYLKKSHVFVLSSKHETFGVSIVEAMACGLPAISTKCGGPEDIIDMSNGYLAKIDSIEEISNYMKDIYDSYNNYDLSKIAFETKEKFGHINLVNNTLKVYRDILNIN
jgi:glycosyltransferase involved in cell wall biosynthesis